MMRIYGYYCPKCRGTEVDWNSFKYAILCVKDKTPIKFFVPVYQYPRRIVKPPKIMLSRSYTRKYRFLWWLRKKGHLALAIWTSKFHIKLLVYCKSTRHDKFPIESKTRLRELMEAHWPWALAQIEEIERERLMEGFDARKVRPFKKTK